LSSDKLQNKLGGFTDSLETRVRDVLELGFEAKTEHGNPFVDVVFDCKFTAPSGKEWVAPGFYDGQGTWKVRFSPNEGGRWTYETVTNVEDSGLRAKGEFDVSEPDKPVRGFLKTCPGKYWGLEYESGFRSVRTILLKDTTTGKPGQPGRGKGLRKNQILTDSTLNISALWTRLCV